MKVQASVKKRCEKCKIVRRERVVRIICTNRRHKQRQGEEDRMARISGVDIPREKRVDVSLCYIYGIGRPTAGKLCKQSGVSPETKVRELTDDEVNRIRELIDKTV